MVSQCALRIASVESNRWAKLPDWDGSAQIDTTGKGADENGENASSREKKAS